MPVLTWSDAPTIFLDAIRSTALERGGLEGARAVARTMVHTNSFALGGIVSLIGPH